MTAVTPTNTNSVANVMGNLDMGTTGSIQMMFAALQLALAQTNKDKALDQINDIKNSQAKAKECADMIAKARELQQQAKSSGGCANMTPELKSFYTANNLKWDTTGNDDKHNNDEWEYNIKSLTNYQEQIGTDTQQKMVFVQDYMGQYNSYLQGANSAIAQSNQTLTAIAKGG
jgi:hypothetical protein